MLRNTQLVNNTYLWDVGQFLIRVLPNKHFPSGHFPNPQRQKGTFLQYIKE